jgi:hypothetical protein
MYSSLFVTLLAFVSARSAFAIPLELDLEDYSLNVLDARQLVCNGGNKLHVPRFGGHMWHGRGCRTWTMTKIPHFQLYFLDN